MINVTFPLSQHERNHFGQVCGTQQYCECFSFLEGTFFTNVTTVLRLPPSSSARSWMGELMWLLFVVLDLPKI